MCGQNENLYNMKYMSNGYIFFSEKYEESSRTVNKIKNHIFFSGGAQFTQSNLP